MISDESKRALRGVEVGFPMGTPRDSPYTAMIKSVIDAAPQQIHHERYFRLTASTTLRETKKHPSWV